MLPNDILLKIFTCIKNPFKLRCVSKQFNKIIYDNRNYIAHFILYKSGFTPDISESYRLYKNYVSIHGINNLSTSGYDLYVSITYSCTEVIELLLTSQEIDPSAHNNYAIGYASRRGCVNSVKLLLADKRVDPSARDNYAVKTAAEKGYTEIVEHLLKDKRVNTFDIK